jgi:hypothetical protein
MTERSRRKLKRDARSGYPPKLRPIFCSCPLPLGEGGALAPGEGSPLHDLQIDEIVGRVALIRRSAHTPPTLFAI